MSLSEQQRLIDLEADFDQPPDAGRPAHRQRARAAEDPPETERADHLDNGSLGAG